MWSGFPWFREQSVDSWQLADIFIKTQCHHSCQEWKIELHSRVTMVRIIKWQFSISSDWSPDTSYLMCRVHSGKSPSRSVGEDIQSSTDGRTWTNYTEDDQVSIKVNLSCRLRISMPEIQVWSTLAVLCGLQRHLYINFVKIVYNA